jgi:hypothetical protein
MARPPQLVFRDDLHHTMASLRWFESFGTAITEYLDMPQPSARTASWENMGVSDKKGCALDLSRMLHLETYIDYEQGSEVGTRVLSQASRHHLHDVVRDYHAALPLNLAELRWLMNEYAFSEQGLGLDRDTLEVWGPDTRPDIELDCYSPTVEQLMMKSCEMIVQGKYKQVTGRVLIDRWWAWRRDSGEYRDLGTNEDARTALRGLATMIGSPFTDGLPGY